MTSWFMRRARAAWLLGIGLVLAGFIPVLIFAGASLLPAAEARPVLGLYPELPAQWKAKTQSWLKARRIAWTPEPVHVGLVFALGGVLVMLGGAAVARRQRLAIDTHRRIAADARRRAQHYRETGRIEPTFGAAAADPREEQRAA